MTTPDQVPEGKQVRITLHGGESFAAFVGAQRAKDDPPMMWVIRDDISEPIEYSEIAHITITGDSDPESFEPLP